MKTRKEISDELSAISSLPEELSAVSPFEVPAGYFESFPEQMLQKIRSLDHSIENEGDALLSPLMAGLRSKQPFSVPEGYFDKLPGNLVKESRPSAKVIRMDPVFYRRMLAAAAVVAVIAAGGWFFVSSSQKSGGTAVASATVGISDKLLHDQAHIIPESEIASYLDSNDVIDGDDQVSDLNPGGDLAALMLSDVSDEELQNYLDHDYAF
jgi:hypothetical protein